MFQIKNFSFSYPTSNKRSLDNINLKFNEGEIILIVGPNGGGKTTLLKSLMGIVPFMTGGKAEGEITYRKNSLSSYAVSRLAGEIGFALQEPENQVTNLTVWDEVTFGPSNLKRDPKKINDQAYRALKDVDLLGEINGQVISLSAGQLQRLSLASLISMNPSTLILDEPVSNLDPHGVHSVISTLQDIKKNIKLIIVSTHWIDPLIDLAKRVVIIDEGKVVTDISIKDLYNNLGVLADHRVEIPQKYKIIAKMKKIGINDYNFNNLEKNEKLFVKIKAANDKLAKGRPLSRVQNASFLYEDKKLILEKINLTLRESEHTVIAGRNGVGKTTLARIISGLLKPSSGSIAFPKGKITLLMQKPTLGFMGETVLEEILYGTKMKKSEAMGWLRKFNLDSFANTSPFGISAGEQRRLALAVAFSQKPKLIILDEPTAGLDSVGVKKLLENLENFNGAVLHISHDIRIVENCARIVVLGKKSVKYDGLRKLIKPRTIRYLGYDLINLNAKLALFLGSSQIPLRAEEMEFSK